MWHLMSDGSCVTATTMNPYILDPWNFVRPTTVKYLLNRAVELGLMEKVGYQGQATIYRRKQA